MMSRLTTERGAALFIALALVIALTMIGLLTVDRAVLDIELSYGQLNREQAFYVAEAGLEHGFTLLKQDSSWRAGITSKPLGVGFYIVTVTDSLTDSSLADTVVLTSRATVNGAVGAVEAYFVSPPPASIFQYATYGDDSMILDNNVCTDSYNSDSGTYAATQLNEQGNVGSNGGIVLTNSSIVNGDAQTSDTGNINVASPSEINGDTTSTGPVIDNSGLVPDAEYAWAETVNNAPAGFSGDYSYNPALGELTLGAGDTMVLASGVYYFSDIELRNGSNIQLVPGAEVTIYMTGDFTLEQSSSVNAWREIDPITNNKITLNGNPRDFLVYSKGDILDLGNLSRFVGAFYSETADIFMRQQVKAYGSFIGNSATIRNLSCVHFDRDLLNIVTKREKRMLMVAWKQL